MIVAAATAQASVPEPRDARMLVVVGSAVQSQAPDGTRKLLLRDAGDASFSPDGTLVAFARGGDLWLANADGSGERRLAATPNVAETRPSWLPSGRALVYTAELDGQRQIRLLRLADASSTRIAPSGGEEYAAAVSRGGRLAFVSTRTGVPVVYRARVDGTGAQPFDAVPPVAPFVDVHDLAWSPDGSKIAYSADQEDATRAIVVDDGTTQVLLPLGERPVWSPTGSRIAFRGETGLASAAADGTDVRSLGTGTPVDWRVVPVGGPLYPNLVQRPPSGLLVEHVGAHWLLGFTSMVDQRGPGILWIRGARKKGARAMRVEQLVELRSGGVRVDVSDGTLRYVVAPPHYHWHFLGFDRFELRNAGDFALRVRDRKSGFCLADHWGHAIGVPHGPPRFLGNCEQFDPQARSVEEGSSVGYTDRYPGFFHGQQLDITGLTTGNYWLVHRANEDFHLRETRYDDNAASLLVRLTWTAGVPHVATLRTCLRERC